MHSVNNIQINYSDLVWRVAFNYFTMNNITEQNRTFNVSYTPETYRHCLS